MLASADLTGRSMYLAEDRILCVLQLWLFADSLSCWELVAKARNSSPVQH